MTVTVPARRELEARVRAADGTLLATTVLLPPGTGPWPATLFRSPYARRNQMIPVTDDGVAVVLQDVRGRFGSGGTFDLGASDAADGATTVAWIAAQPWCDGSVAMHGVSYAGHTQLLAAVARPPALRAISPVRCPAWWRPLAMHEGGALLLSLLAHWLPLQAAQAPECPDSERERVWRSALAFEDVVDYPPGPPTAQGTLALDRALAHPALTARPLVDRPALDAVPVYAALWRRAVTRPHPHTWLTEPGPAPGSGPACPTLVLSGWYDVWAQDAVAMHAALVRRDGASSPHRLVMTPYSHAPEAAGELERPPDADRFADPCALEWNLEWLRDAPGRMRELAPVTWAVVGAGRWEEASTWPPPGATRVTLHLEAGPGRGRGSLGCQARRGAANVAFVCDPREPMPSAGGPQLGLPMGPIDVRSLGPAHRPDVCSFTSAALDEPLELAGPVVAQVTLSSSAADADVVVRLLDERADGRVLTIAEGVTRARWRHGPPGRPLRPGVPERIGVHLWNAAYLLAAGSRLRVDVCGGSFPRIEPNAHSGLPPGTDTAHDLRAATLRVHTGEAASTVELVVRDRRFRSTARASLA